MENKKDGRLFEGSGKGIFKDGKSIFYREIAKCIPLDTSNTLDKKQLETICSFLIIISVYYLK